MGSLFSSFACCFWWFLAGILIGWLLNRWLCKCSGKPIQQVTDTPVPNQPPTNTASAKAAEAPVTNSPATPKAVAPTTAVIDLAAAKKAGFTIKNANDLTIVEGIGPK